MGISIVTFSYRYWSRWSDSARVSEEISLANNIVGNKKQTAGKSGIALAARAGRETPAKRSDPSLDQ
jgi:hypothetical protein